MDQRVAYFCGEWIPDERLCLPVDDLGFSVGATIVERLRTFGGQVFRLTDHMHRLQRSLEIVGWNSESLTSKIEAAVRDYPVRNADCLADGDDWAIVAFVTPGRTPTAERPTVCVHGFPLLFHQFAEHFRSGLEAVIVDVRQVPSNCWPAELKCRSRIHYYMADREAAAKSPGARAILLDQDGLVGEATTANVIAYFADEGLVTPPRDKVLPGVSQQVLFEIADELKIPHSERDITPAELASADEAYLTSTSICVLPIVRLDGQPIGKGHPGQTYKRLLSAWSDLVGLDIVTQAEKFSRR